MSRRPVDHVPNPEGTRSLAIAISRKLAREIKQIDPTKSYTANIQTMFDVWQKHKKRHLLKSNAEKKTDLAI